MANDTGNALNLLHELKCFRCGYDLRGLPVEGRCPECGETVAATLHDALLRRTALDDLPAGVMSLRTLKQVTEGGACLVLSMIATLSLVLAPQWAYGHKSNWRVAMLCVACIGFAASIVAMWKFGTQLHVSKFRPDDIFGWLLRAMAILYLLLILLATLIGDYRHPMSLSGWRALRDNMNLLAWSIPLAGGFLFLRISQVCKQIGRPVLGVLAPLLTCVAPALIVLFIGFQSRSYRRYEFNSLEFLSWFSVFPIGPPEFWKGNAFVWMKLWKSSESIAFTLVMLVCTLSGSLSVAFTVQAYRALRAARDQEKLTNESTARNFQQ